MTSPLAGLGRLLQWDDRNLAHLLPRKSVPRDVRSRYWHAGPILDQGNTPQCVGHAGHSWLSAGPVVNRPRITPRELYLLAQDNDEWPGRNYDGTSTLGLMKALKSLGYISEYRWATDAETVVAWVLTSGPVIIGSDWFEDMANPDKDGFIWPGGKNYGGHEWLIIGANRDKPTPRGDKGAVRIFNSWGEGWADGGRAWLAISDLDHLIKNNGEAVTSPEIKLPA